MQPYGRVVWPSGVTPGWTVSDYTSAGSLPGMKASKAASNCSR